MAHANAETRVIRIPLRTKQKLQKVAIEQRRTMSAQLDLIIDEWLDARQSTAGNGHRAQP